MNFIINFIRFSRLHTVIGTALSLISLYFIALSYGNHQAGNFTEVFFLTLICCLGANIFIVGLNQVTDVEIDKVNKPYLPLASGAFSMRLGYIIIGVSVLVSLLLAFNIGGYLLWTVILSLILGIAYSLPPFRLKRFSFWAAFCIIAVRGLIVNLLLFLHFNSVINQSSDIPPLVWTLTAVIFVYSLIIALFKDLPDTEGDELYNIKTLSVKLGRKRVFNFGNIILTVLFLTLIILPFFLKLNISAVPFAILHALFLAALWWQISRTDLQNQKAVFGYYRFIWVLFFGEYAAFALLSV